MPRTIRVIPSRSPAINMTRILFTALIAGCIAGIFAFGVQATKLAPLILQAEVYEDADNAKKAAAQEAMEKSMHMDHQQMEEGAWEPANGLERNAYRLLADIGVGVGFALVLIGAFTLRGEKMNAQKGLLWGLAGFAVFALAPGFGLSPELPATMAAALDERQFWWIGCALATAIGIALAVYGRTPLKIAGVVLMVIPHVVGAPHPPLGGVVPTELNAEFAAASLVTAAVFWIMLGLMSGWLYGVKERTGHVA